VVDLAAGFLGGVGGILIVASALFGRRGPDLLSVAYGLTVSGFLLQQSAMNAN
jgi:hypothetical protein